MASKKISELPASGALTGVELVEAVQGGVNVQTTTQDIADLGGGGGGAVDSVNSQTGVVVLDAGDIGVTPTGNIISTNVQAAIAELDSDIAAGLAGLKWKDPVRVATTVAGTLATSFENGDTVDGVVLATGNRILIKNQADQTENGIRVVAASGAPARSTDADAAVELEGAAVSVLEGTTNANTTWLQTTDSITLGVSNIVWGQFGSSVPDADETTKGIAERATDAEVITGSDTTRFVSPASLHAKVIGVQDLFIPAAAMWPRVTSGCSVLTQYEIATSLFNVQGLEFSDTTQQFAQMQIVLPRKYNNSTITAVVYWRPVSSSSGTVQWGISGGAYSNDDALTVALGTAQTVDDTFIATDDLHVTDATSAITLAGTPADADFLAIQISRNPASDTLAVNAILLGISLRVTIDQAKDA